MRTTTLLIAASLGCLAAPAFAAPAGTVGEVTEFEGSLAVRVDAGSKAGVRVGQSAEVRRDGKTIGYGSVVELAEARCLVSVGTVVAGAEGLRLGDQVVFLDAGFTPGGAQPKGPVRETERTDKPTPPTGRVASVRDGLVLLDIGRSSGLRVGDTVVVYDRKAQEVARLRVELIGPNSAGGLLESGTVERGMRVRSIGSAAERIDFVALDFLGVVADLEHPTPHRAACHIGVPVRRVLPGSPAQKAGLGRGDRLVSVDGIVVRDIAAVRERIEAREGDVVRVALIRGDRLVFVDVDFRPK